MADLPLFLGVKIGTKLPYMDAWTGMHTYPQPTSYFKGIIEDSINMKFLLALTSLLTIGCHVAEDWADGMHLHDNENFGRDEDCDLEECEVNQ